MYAGVHRHTRDAGGAFAHLRGVRGDPQRRHHAGRGRQRNEAEARAAPAGLSRESGNPSGGEAGVGAGAWGRLSRGHPENPARSIRTAPGRPTLGGGEARGGGVAVPGPEGRENFVLCRSQERRAKERAIHERFAQRLEAILPKRAHRMAQAQRLPLAHGSSGRLGGFWAATPDPRPCRTCREPRPPRLTERVCMGTARSPQNGRSGPPCARAIPCSCPACKGGPALTCGRPASS